MTFRKKATWIVVFLVLLFIAGLARESIAAEIHVGQATNGYTEYDGGETFMFTERIGLTRWHAGFGWTNEREYDGRFVDQNMYGFVERRVTVPVVRRCELGVGLAYLQNTDYIQGSRFNYSLSATCRVMGSLRLGARHFSNAGTSYPNRGYDFVLLTWSF